MSKQDQNQNGAGLSRSHSSAGSVNLAGVKMEDLRKFAIEHKSLPHTKVVRVSDEYWMLVVDGVPKTAMKHDSFFEALNTKLRNAHTKTQ